MSLTAESATAPQAERAEESAERSMWRLSDMEKKNENLQYELNQLREMMAEERQAANDAVQTATRDLSHLDKEELIARAQKLQTAYGRM